VLRIEKLNKRYGNRSVLQDLSLAIAPGEIYGLLGPNGAGKTTAINIICNLLRADHGIVEIDGLPVSRATQKLIGIMPQENLLYRSLTCWENLDFFARIYGLSRSLRLKQIRYCLEVVNLADRAHSPVEVLSGGMQRRLSLAIALVHQPKLIILDEPTTGLDIEARYEIWQLIEQFRRQGITVLLTTHLLEEAERLCQRIGILKGGRILAEGTLAELQKYVPATEIAIVKTSEEEKAIACASAHGLISRRYGSDLAFWLPHSMELAQILDCFQTVALDSICRQPIRLEHVYVEVTQASSDRRELLNRGLK
jgi:ABC-2 type transport system ATP-binding protein